MRLSTLLITSAITLGACSTSLAQDNTTQCTYEDCKEISSDKGYRCLITTYKNSGAGRSVASSQLSFWSHGQSSDSYSVRIDNQTYHDAKCASAQCTVSIEEGASCYA